MERKRFVTEGLFVLAAAVCFVGCHDSSTGKTPADPGQQPVTDYTGTYRVAIGHTPTFIMDIIHTGNAVTFTVTGDEEFDGTGTAAGRDLTLSASLPGLADLVIRITFSADGTTFSGTWEAVSGGPMSGSITGQISDWVRFDIDTLGTPRFADADIIELGKIRRLSRLRSGIGHDYSDDFETCRSMKHYYEPKLSENHRSVKIFSPVAGTVIGTTEEWDGPSLWKGEAVGIRPEGFPAFDLVLFHIDLHQPLSPGDVVTVGQELGTSAKQSGTVTDLAVGVHTPAGHRLISFFEVASDSVFALYEARGVQSRDELIITREERDADPLSCTGDQFADGGSIQNWVDLND